MNFSKKYSIYPKLSLKTNNTARYGFSKGLQNFMSQGLSLERGGLYFVLQKSVHWSVVSYLKTTRSYGVLSKKCTHKEKQLQNYRKEINFLATGRQEWEQGKRIPFCKINLSLSAFHIEEYFACIWCRLGQRIYEMFNSRLLFALFPFTRYSFRKKSLKKGNSSG